MTNIIQTPCEQCEVMLTAPDSIYGADTEFGGTELSWTSRDSSLAHIDPITIDQVIPTEQNTQTYDIYWTCPECEFQFQQLNRSV